MDPITTSVASAAISAGFSNLKKNATYGADGYYVIRKIPHLHEYSFARGLHLGLIEVGVWEYRNLVYKGRAKKFMKESHTSEQRFYIKKSQVIGYMFIYVE